MRSELVFAANTYVPNRFLLTGLASKAVRKLHRPNTRMQNTANDVLVRFSRANPWQLCRFRGDLHLFHFVALAETRSWRCTTV
jgi:hypothetical protein